MKYEITMLSGTDEEKTITLELSESTTESRPFLESGSFVLFYNGSTIVASIPYSRIVSIIKL